MRRILTILLLATTLVACNNKNPHDGNAISIYIVGGDEVWVAGREGVTHTVECKVYGVAEQYPVLDATTEDEWIEIKNCSINLVLYKTLDNHTGAPREGHITISYGGKSSTLTVIQRPYAQREYEALSLHGSTYNGYEEGEHEGYNYNLVLSQVGVDKSGCLYEKSEYYILNLYSPTPANGNMSWTLPQDVEIDLENSYYIKTGEDVATSVEIALKEATISVGSKMIEAHVVLDNEMSDSVNIWYRGALYQNMTLYSFLSTLEEDYTFNHQDAIFAYELSEDNSCTIYIVKQIEGEDIDIFQLSLQLPEGASDIVGEYQQGDAASAFIAGSMGDEESAYVGSWYMKYDDTERAPMVDGKITISKSESETYTFDIDVTDDLKHRIKGTIIATKAEV